MKLHLHSFFVDNSTRLWYSGRQSAQAGDLAAIQVVSTLLHFLQHVQWLAKDIVWVVSDANCSSGHMTKVRLALAMADAMCFLLIKVTQLRYCNKNLDIPELTGLQFTPAICRNG